MPPLEVTTNENTVMEPLGPLKRFQVWPARLMLDATGDPVLEIGPAPP